MVYLTLLYTMTGGCGNMFEVHIVSEEFRGVRAVMQHRMVNEVWYNACNAKFQP